jgi:hypothetical protein
VPNSWSPKSVPCTRPKGSSLLIVPTPVLSPTGAPSVTLDS